MSTKRVALVIGNSNYGGDNVSGVEDAKAMADCLSGLGFTIPPQLIVLDGTLEATTQALAAFQNEIVDADAVVFFYSGHGFQLQGQNFLQPVDGTISTTGAFAVDKIIQRLAAAPKAVKFVFLDACRENGQLSAGDPQGLASPGPAVLGVIQSFAASPGQLAASGSVDGLSPYTAALLRALPVPGLGLNELFAQVHSDVPRTQEPIIQAAALPDDFFFRPPVFVQAVVPVAHSEILAIINGNVVLDTDQAVTDPLSLRLNAGDNTLLLYVSSGRNHRNNHDWDITEGWQYALDLTLPDGTVTPSNDGKIHFTDGEDTPFKDGPHYGKIFEVAQATLNVDPQSAVLTVTNLEMDLATKNAQFFAQDQDILYQVSIADLDLTPDDILGGAVDLGSAAAILQPFLVELLKSGTILGATIADPAKTFVTVLGNKAFKDLATGCMAMRDDRIRDLKASIAAAFNRNPTPFDVFDQGLIACMRSTPIPAGSPFTSDDIRVWTALTDESQNQPVAVPPAANAEEAMPAMAHQG